MVTLAEIEAIAAQARDPEGNPIPADDKEAKWLAGRLAKIEAIETSEEEGDPTQNAWERFPG